MTIGNEEIQKMLDDERAKLAPEKVAAFEATDAMKAMLAVPEKTDDSVYEFGGLKIGARFPLLNDVTLPVPVTTMI